MFLILFVILVACLVYYCHYRGRKITKYFDKIPGPPCLPIIGSAHLLLDFDDIRNTCDGMLKKYGPTIKLWIFWVPVIIVSDPKHLQIVLNSPACINKEKHYHLAQDVLGNGLITAKGKDWRRQRKLLTPAFGKKIITSFVESFIKHSEELVNQLEKEAGTNKPFDADHYLQRCTLDFICETAMGVDVNAQNKPSCKIIDMGNRCGKILVMRAFRVWLHFNILFRNSALGREFYTLADHLHSFCGDVIKRKLDESGANELVFDGKTQANNQPNELAKFSKFVDNIKKPFLDHLMSLGDKMTHKELRTEVELFIVVGSDTVATTSQYVLVTLGMHKDIQEKVREELYEVFGDTDRQLCLDDLPNLPYLDRVIKETMRLYSPVGFIARSIDSDVDLGDFVIPAGVSIIVPISGAHRNPDVWKDPLKFDPDRFLPEEVEKRHRYSYLPFSKGPRDCIGKLYALEACKVLLASVLRKYKIDTTITPETIKFTTEISSKIHGGANITITKLE